MQYQVSPYGVVCVSEADIGGLYSREAMRGCVRQLPDIYPHFRLVCRRACACLWVDQEFIYQYLRDGGGTTEDCTLRAKT